jgi:hypothetical protein
MDKVRVSLSLIIVGLVVYIFVNHRSINKLEKYNELLSDYTYVYGSQLKLGYSIPLRVDYIQNDTLYLVTRDVENLKPTNK